MVGLVAAVPVALALAFAAGRYAATAPSTFDWATAAGAGTAAGTLALALVTGFLAALTYDEVRLTRSIEAERHRPTLVIERRRHIDVHQDPGAATGKFVVEFRNYGMGPAIHVQVVATYGDPDIEVGIPEPVPAVAVDTDAPAVVEVPWAVRRATQSPDQGELQRPHPPDVERFAVVMGCFDRTGLPIANAVAFIRPPGEPKS